MCIRDSILAVPIDQYFISLPTNASVTGFAVILFLILAGTVLNSDHYSFDDAAYPIAVSYTHLLANYEPSLQYFSEWWKQLAGESEGKDQRGIYPTSALSLIHI